MYECKICNKKYAKIQAYAGHHSTHSKKFQGFITKQREAYYKNPKTCRRCSAVLPHKTCNIFCSHTCSAIYNNLKKERKYKQFGLCSNCNTSYLKKGAKKYCCRKCQIEYEYKQKHMKVLESGYIDQVFGCDSTRRKYLLKTREHKCVICSNTEWMNRPIPLVMDHINGNSDDWALTNLRLICGNCDMQTSTYKGKNKGKGRHVRRLRYKMGKSY